MQLLKTKFYPVDVDGRIIHLDPKARERDVARKWPSNVIGLRGDQLLANKCYEAYRRVPTVTRDTLLSEWKEEAARSKYLWESAAKLIVAVLEEMALDAALATLKKQLKASRHMAINASYGRVVEDLKTAISQQAQAS